MEHTLIPNQLKGAMGSRAYRYKVMNGSRDMVGWGQGITNVEVKVAGGKQKKS
jgi:hypothetical protein